jgi:hypothetical protein
MEVVGGPGVAIQRDTGGVGMKGGRGWKGREVVKDSIQSFQDVNGNVDLCGDSGLERLLFLVLSVF